MFCPNLHNYILFISLGLPESLKKVVKSGVGGHLASEGHLIDPALKFRSKSLIDADTVYFLNKIDHCAYEKHARER